MRHNCCMDDLFAEIMSTLPDIPSIQGDTSLTSSGVLETKVGIIWDSAEARSLCGSSTVVPCPADHVFRKETADEVPQGHARGLAPGRRLCLLELLALASGLSRLAP